MRHPGQRKINLLNKGTGIRFDLTPQRKSIQKPKQLRVVFTLITLSLLAWISFTLGGMMLDFLDFRERVASNETGRGSSKSGVGETKKGGSGGEKSGSTSAVGETAFNVRPKVQPIKSLPEAKEVEGGAEEVVEKTAEVAYYVRYALFLDKVNAETYSAKLQKSGLDSWVFETQYPLPSYTIKAGPFMNPNSRKMAQKELKKLGVALTPFLEQKYLLSKPVWKKNKASDIQRRLFVIGVSSELSMERTPKTVFKVISGSFDDRRGAREYAKVAKKAGLKVIVEEGEKRDEPEDEGEDGEINGEEPKENGEKQQK